MRCYFGHLIFKDLGVLYLRNLPIFFFLIGFIFINSTAFSQQKTITGTVTRSDGSPLYGATVTIKGSDKATITDTTGSFVLTVKQNDILEVSFVGYSTRQFFVGNQTQLNIILDEEVKALDDVVVIGYGTTKKKDLTGAIGSVSAKDFNKGIFTSPDQLIQGKVAGLQITKNNGLPGAATTIKIRGNSALSGTGQPLYVIDGVPLDGRSVQGGNNPLNFINPGDIASIDVLKDASATAIFGARAAFGVIIINTKKGQAGQPIISVAISTGISSILRKIEILNAEQFREAIQYYGVSSTNDKGGNTNALDAILQNGFQTDYTISINGGNENGKYRISGNLLNQDGIIKNSDFKK